MGRWAETVTLLSPEGRWQDKAGAWHEGDREPREVFCDVGTIGLMTMAQLRSSEVRVTSGDRAPEVGIREMHVLRIRRVDYGGEDQVVFRGKEMDVIAATSDGEDYKVIVRRRLGND